MRLYDVPEMFKETFKSIVLDRDNSFNCSDSDIGTSLSKRVGKEYGQLIIFSFSEKENGDYTYHMYNPITGHKWCRDCKCFGEVIEHLVMDIKILA